MRHAASPRIVISGVGVVSPFGVGRERFWECVSGCCSGTRAVTAALATSSGFLPPTIDHHDPDPTCDLDVIPNQGRAADVEAALCHYLGFGSRNSALVIGRASANYPMTLTDV